MLTASLSFDKSHSGGTGIMKQRDILISLGVIVIALCVILFLRPGKGYIALETPGVELELHGGLFTNMVLRSESKQNEVAARVYTPKLLRLTGKENGDAWLLESSGPWGNLSRIKVTKAQTTTVKLGPPLLIKPEARYSNGQVSVEWSIIGQAGEKYRNVVLKNGSRSPEPKVKIFDQDGKVLVEDKFAYG